LLRNIDVLIKEESPGFGEFDTLAISFYKKIIDASKSSRELLNECFDIYEKARNKKHLNQIFGHIFSYMECIGD